MGVMEKQKVTALVNEGRKFVAEMYDSRVGWKHSTRKVRDSGNQECNCGLWVPFIFVEHCRQVIQMGVISHQLGYPVSYLVSICLDDR